MNKNIYGFDLGENAFDDEPIKELEDKAYEYAAEQLKDFKTDCCHARVYKKGRADIRCIICGKDVTMELVWLTDLFIREFKNKKKLQNTKEKINTNRGANANKNKERYI